MQEPLIVNGLVGLFGVLEVPHKQVSSSVANLSFSLCGVLKGYDFFLSARKLLTDLLEGVEIPKVKSVDVREILGTRGLAHAITVNEEDVEREEVTADFGIHGSSSVEEELALIQP